MVNGELCKKQLLDSQRRRPLGRESSTPIYSSKLNILRFSTWLLHPHPQGVSLLYVRGKTDIKKNNFKKVSQKMKSRDFKISAAGVPKMEASKNHWSFFKIWAKEIIYFK